VFVSNTSVQRSPLRVDETLSKCYVHLWWIVLLFEHKSCHGFFPDHVLLFMNSLNRNTNQPRRLPPFGIFFWHAVPSTYTLRERFALEVCHRQTHIFVINSWCLKKCYPHHPLSPRPVPIIATLLTVVVHHNITIILRS